MIQVEKKPTTWAELNRLLALAELNGAERAKSMTLGMGKLPSGEQLVELFDRSISILQGEADDYAETARREAEAREARQAAA